MLDQARSFALAAHGTQMYGARPYVFHLDAVVRLLAPWGVEAQVIGYLHDVIEDTPITEREIREHFGRLIADCVSLLTDPPGANRADRKARAYAKLAGVSGANEVALVVKAADRLANVRCCLIDDRRALHKLYRREHPAFRQAAYREGLCDSLWTELDTLLAIDLESADAASTAGES